jgi:hypothetical protein
MLNLYQNNTAARNQTAIREMVNLDAYYELCKGLFIFNLSFRRRTKLCYAKVHEKSCELFQHLNLGRVLVPHREKDRNLYRLSDRCADSLHCLLASLPQWVELPDL